MDVSDLPTLNACLNAASAVLLTAGYAFIRLRRTTAHRNCMVTAFVVSCLFLASYVVYHVQGGFKSFEGGGVVWWVYRAILISHIVLAVVIVPMALVTLYQAARGHFERHRRVARWTLPLWWYVSVTGVVIYGMLYHWPMER